MTDADLKRIEKELKLKLPAAYVKIMRDFPEELRNWPDMPGADRSEWFFTDAAQVIDANRRIRKQPGEFVKSPPKHRKEWPENLFVFGRCGKNWHAVDATLDDPPLVEIVDGKVDEGGQELSFCFTWVKYKHITDWQKHKDEAKKQAKAAKPAKAARPAAGTLSDADLKEIEQKLELKLPAVYCRIVRDFPQDLRNWPEEMPGGVYDARDDFLFDVKEIVQLTQQARKRLKQDFPARGLVFGGRKGGSCWMIDTALDDPPVQLVHKADYILTGLKNLAELMSRMKDAHQQAWAKSKKLARAGGKASLTPDALIAEGRRLAQPAVALRDKGTKYAAVWRGTGVASPGAGEWRHWISIDTSFLPDNPRKLKGVISLYEWFADDDRMGELKVAHDPKASLPRKTDGTKLYAKSFNCLPDVEAVFQFGSKPVKDWAKATSWDANAGFNESPIKEYQAEVQSQHPFASGDGTYAMLGGWSWCFTWCYTMDEKYPWNLMKKALIVLTIAESEPWIEVFDDGKKFVTFSRIT
jgi:hypothetical protein